MNYTKQYISELANKNNFLINNTEKVIRLLDTLTYIFDPTFPYYNKLVLKGGTAINLAYSDLTRLSVDIDLDYVGSIDKNVAFIDKTLIFEQLDIYMEKQGYNVSSKSRSSAILESRVYSYINASGNMDNIKVEINFINRVHLSDYVCKKINYFERELEVVCVEKHELYGMKIAALLDRGKPRDLYDIYKAFKNKKFDLIYLKKAAIYYLSLDKIFDINDTVLNRIKLISKNQIKRELLPVISKEDRFDLDIAKKEVFNTIKKLFIISSDEMHYLFSFKNGVYKPELLFDEIISQKIINHPMAMWLTNNIKRN